MTTSGSFAIGEFSRRTRCNIETIRYYERVGLLPQAARRGRYRSFGQADVARLHFIRRARELGFTLDEIRTLLGMATTDNISCDDAREIAALHLKQVRARIADLKRMERVLADTVRACSSGDHIGCPLITTLSAVP